MSTIMQNDYGCIIGNLESELERLKEQNLSKFIFIEHASQLCKQAYRELRDKAIDIGFIDKKQEIHFFKITKPRIYSKLIFYRRLARVESHRPKYTQEDELLYLKKHIHTLQCFYDEHREFYEYYRTEKEYQDMLYFTRNRTEIIFTNRNADYLIDPEFSTIHDKTVATIIAYTNLEKYLNNEIHKLTSEANFEGGGKNYDPIKKYRWTGTQYEYVEFLYSIRASDVINGGMSGLKELHNLFSKILHIPETDIYKVFQDIKGRKKSKTIFLDKLKNLLLRNIDRSDEFSPES